MIRSTTITPTQLSPSRRQFLFLQSHVQSPNSISTSIQPSLNNLLFSRSRQIEHHSLTDVLPAISARNTGFQIYSLGWVSLSDSSYINDYFFKISLLFSRKSIIYLWLKTAASSSFVIEDEMFGNHFRCRSDNNCNKGTVFKKQNSTKLVG